MAALANQILRKSLSPAKLMLRLGLAPAKLLLTLGPAPAKLMLRLGLAGLCLSLVLSGCTGDSGKLPSPSLPFVRKNASTPAAKEDLLALAKAMAIMKAMPCDDVRSWYYQGAIHSIPDTVPNGNPLCQSYTRMAQMKTAWMNCTHDPMGSSELHFLIWHRLYIWHFEKIVRALSGKTDFALPYWDYCDPNYRVMPALLRDPADSLFESARLGSLNAGEPIDTFMNARLDMTNNNESKLYSLFDSQIDAAPHGAMHNYIGGQYAGDSTLWNRIYQGPNYGLMAQVESAGFDPIFWLHHANIDYLWQKWDMSANGARPILEDLLRQPWAYVFFDETGKKVEYSIQSAFEQAFNMDYIYDSLPVAPKMLNLQKPVPENPHEILSSDLEESISAPLHSIAIKTPGTKPMQMQAQVAARRVTVLEVTVGFTQQPRLDYQVYIDTDKPEERKLAGIMTFFGAMHMQKPAAEYTKLFRFDITDEYDVNTMGKTVKLLIVNSKGQKATEISVKKVRIETRDF